MRENLTYNVPMKLNYTNALKAAVKAREAALAVWLDNETDENFNEYNRYKSLVDYILVRVRRRRGNSTACPTIDLSTSNKDIF